MPQQHKNTDIHHFTPAFALPENAEDKGAVFTHPNADKMTSRADVNPIHLNVTIPLSRKVSGDKTNQKMTVHFRVKVQHITTKISGPDGQENALLNTDWYDLLTEQERLQALQYIMAEFRHNSFGNDGFRVAAIGITPSHELFIASNTRPHHSLYKKCAETAIISAATQHASHTRKDPEYPEKLKSKNPKKLFENVYVMGAQDNIAQSSMACPCGSCSDELFDHMAMIGEENIAQTSGETSAHIYILPTAAETQKDADGNIILSALKINDQAKNISELNAQECWKVTPEKLHGLHVFPVSDTLKQLQQKDLKQALTAGSSLTQSDALQQKIASYLQSLSGAKEVGDKPKTRVSEPSLNGTMKMMAVAKTLMQNHPLIALEASAAQNEEGHKTPSLTALNQFMSHEIHKILANRLQNWQQNGDDITTENLSEHMEFIRCAVVQLKDGTLMYGTEANSTRDSAMPHAEFSALTSRLDRIDKQHNPVAEIWVMDLDPAAIARGEIPAFSCDVAERLAKRSQNPYNIKTHFIPYNNGALDGQKLARFMTSAKSGDITLDKINPGMFAGRVTAAKKSAGTGAEAGTGTTEQTR
jgi:cytidine deaminase